MVGNNSAFPILILTNPKYKVNRTGIYFASIFTISGFILNRMNVCVTSLVGSSGQSYTPSFEEIGITLFLLMSAMIAFKFVVENFNVFEKEEHVEDAVVDKKQILSNKILLNK